MENFSIFPPTIEGVKERIRAYAREQKWSKRRLALEADMSDTVISDIWEAKWSPSAATIERLEKVVPPDFGMTPKITTTSEGNHGEGSDS